MKGSFVFGVLAAAVWLSPVLVSQGQTDPPELDPFDSSGEVNELPKQIRVQVEFIELSHDQLIELMFGGKGSDQ